MAGGASATPSSPSTSTPDANTAVDTSAFESAVAADAATPDAETPDSNTPESDAANPDQTVDPDALDASDAAAAGAVAAGAAGVVGLHAGASGGKAPSTPTSPTGPASPATPSAPSSNAPSSPSSNTPSSPTPDANTPAAPGTPDATSPDANTPETPEGSNSTERTTAEIDTALAEINPNFDPFDPANGYATNCGNTSAILNDFLNGNPSSEAPTGTLGVPEMEARTGNPQTRMTPDQIADSLREMGAGSHCVVGIDRSSGDGHWFNAYFDGDTVWSIDAQTGTRSAWPPNEPNATNWDASIRPEDVADPKTPEADAPSGDTPSTDSPVTSPPSPDKAGQDGADASTRGTADGSTSRFDPSIVETLSPESQAIISAVEAEGRQDFRSDELDALHADPAVRDAVDANPDVKRRVKLRVQVARDIIAGADRNREGDFVTQPNDTVVPCRRYPDGTPMRFDPETGKLVPPGTPGMTMPVRRAFDFGHIPDHQWRDTRIIATLENRWSRRDILEYENEESHYRIEDFRENRSNRYNRTP